MKVNLLVLLFLTAGPAFAGDLRLGRAAVKITPPPGMPMAGYYYTRLAEGTHDDLYAKALVLEKDGRKAAIVSCDLGHLTRHIVEGARREIEKTTGLRGDQVMISATHSHTGPVLGGDSERAAASGGSLPVAKQYLSELPARIAESVRMAEANLAVARAWAGVGHEENLSFNRRFLMKDGTVGWNPGKLNPHIVRPTGPIDPDVAVAYFDSPEEKPLATFVNFSMHLDTVGGRQFSADYPYVLSRLLGALKGPDMLTVFTIGAAGDVNHLDVKDPREQKGHAEAARIGTILAGEVLKTYARLRAVPAGVLKVRREVVELPLAAISQDEVSKARELASRFGQADAPKFMDLVHAFKVIEVDERKGKPLEAEVQVITLGDQLAWVGLPGEVFVELGLGVKRASPFRYTIISELSGASPGYVPTRKAYAEGNYEAVSARCAAGSGEMLVEKAIRMLMEMYQR